MCVYCTKDKKAKTGALVQPYTPPRRSTSISPYIIQRGVRTTGRKVVAPKTTGGLRTTIAFFDRLLDSGCIFSLTFFNNGQRPRKYFSYFNACNALGRDPILDV